MKSSIYVETSIVSYLTARPNRDLVRAAHQEITREWWATRGAFDLYISQLVLELRAHRQRDDAPEDRSDLSRQQF